MKSRHIQTVTQRLTLEIGFAGELGAAGLTEAIIEALEKGGVMEEAGIVYIRAEAPGHELMAIDIWAPEPEAPVIPADPPVMPTPDEGFDDAITVDGEEMRVTSVEEQPDPR